MAAAFSPVCFSSFAFINTDPLRKSVFSLSPSLYTYIIHVHCTCNVLCTNVCYFMCRRCPMRAFWALRSWMGIRCRSTAWCFHRHVPSRSTWRRPTARHTSSWTRASSRTPSCLTRTSHQTEAGVRRNRCPDYRKGSEGAPASRWLYVACWTPCAYGILQATWELDKFY